ncbi:MAG: arginase family protein [Candidatus Micrarchaeia archaeon]
MHDILPIYLTDGGEDWYDVAEKGAKLPVKKPDEFGSTIEGTRSPDCVNTKEIVLDYLPAGKFFVSNDHAVTYPIAIRHEIAAFAQEDPVGLSMIVFDAHMDIYPQNQDCDLTKANVLRILDEKEFIEKIIFVGTRASEELILHEHSRKVAEFNQEYAKGWREYGTFDEIGAQVQVIPADEIGSFAEGLQKALALCNPQNRVGIDVDLDVFEKIGAVQYGELFGEQLEKFVKERRAFAKKNRIKVDEEKTKEIRDYAQFAGNEMNERGLGAKLDAAKISACFANLGDRLAFLHVTEYEQENDKKGKAAKLIGELFDAAANGLAEAANKPEKENEEDDE